MKPDEAADIMNREADELMRVVRQLRSRKSSDFDNRDLLNWFCHALQQHAIFKQSISDVIREMGQKYPDFRLESHDNNNQMVIKEASSSVNIEAPPFDTNFWMGLGDI